MKKQICVCVSIGLFAMIVVSIAVVSNYSYAFISAKEADLQYYLEWPPENNYYADEECIPDAQTAARIGSVIIDNMCDRGAFDIGSTSVEYDSANRLWLVNKGSLFSRGGCVVIRQDTGEVVRALLNK